MKKAYLLTGHMRVNEELFNFTSIIGAVSFEEAHKQFLETHDNIVDISILDISQQILAAAKDIS